MEANELPAALRKTATSIRIESGQMVDRAGLAVAILRELDRDYERIKRGEFDVIAEQWQEHCSTIGSQVSIRVGDRVDSRPGGIARCGRGAAAARAARPFGANHRRGCDDGEIIMACRAATVTARHFSQSEKWWAMRDSNPRPTACKAAALPLR